MCNLYSQLRAREAMARMFNVSDNRLGAVEPQPAIFPGQDAPVVRLADDGERELVTMSWGFVLVQKDRAPKRVTNARDDKVLQSRFWHASFRERRCLIPVTSFSEPKGRNPAVWHWFALDDTRPLFAFAGLWRSWRGPLKKDGENVETNVYSFLTTRPNEVVKPIHPNRMPVMLTQQEHFKTWLNGTDEEAFALAKPYPEDGMKIVAKGEKADELTNAA